MTQYQSLEANYKQAHAALDRKCNQVSTLRLLAATAFLISAYYAFNTEGLSWKLFAAAAFIAFLILMRWHQRLSWQRLLKKTLVDINHNETQYLEHQNLPFGDGIEHQIDPTHPYAYDVDIFGQRGLYQHLNRTATYIGSKKLADLLLCRLPNTDIEQNQAAIKALSGHLDWRQNIFALAKITNDNKASYQKLLAWSVAQNTKPSKFIHLVSFVSPVILLVSMTLSWLLPITAFAKIATCLFLFHLFITMLQLKKIKQEIVDSEKIHEVLRHYSLIITEIENQTFETDKLKALQAQLHDESGPASIKIKRLSSLFSNLQSIENPMGALFSNGLLLLHSHTLRNLIEWKTAHAQQLVTWLNVIGTIESLNSLANLGYNNPEFTYPDINNKFDISFTNLGHPLIRPEYRVCNSISFNQANMTILTGSNMSGKSTFLRTLGINMVLTGAGAPICATQASVHPLDILVSMRLADSLSENESYFFAEVKRLKQIMDTLQDKVCFVLLDEILRGTNSDDKRNGTIEVVKKLIAKNAIGVIATHDIEVCNTTDEYPDKLINRCFEVEVINNDLAFDYKLRDGICKNRSATFLMKKMNVI